MKVITKVVVGSRLHGLNNEDSDWDYRGIHMYSLKDTLSPFKKLKNTDWVEGETDNTSYELAEFCKNATQGNATILEVFFSTKVEDTTPIADEMRANWKKFIDTDRFVMASRGYAANQLNKMALFDDIGIKQQNRTPKFAVAYIRVLWQCSEFLKTGQFKCRIDDDKLRDFLMGVKYNWSDNLVPELTERFSLMQGEVSKAWATAPKLKPDIKWIEEFIYRAYKEQA
jgi:predicted nucleotidyltransferase